MLNCTNDFKKQKLGWVILTCKQSCEHIWFFLFFFFLTVNKDLLIVIPRRIFTIFLSCKFSSRKSVLWKRSQFFSLKNYFYCVHYYRSFLKGNRHFLKMRVGMWWLMFLTQGESLLLAFYMEGTMWQGTKNSL